MNRIYGLRITLVIWDFRLLWKCVRAGGAGIKFFRETGILNTLLTVIPGTSGIASQWFNQVLTEESRGGHISSVGGGGSLLHQPHPCLYAHRRKTNYAKGFFLLFLFFLFSVTRIPLKRLLTSPLWFSLLLCSSAFHHVSHNFDSLWGM